MAPKSRKRNAQDAPSASHVPKTTEPTYDAIRFRLGITLLREFYANAKKTRRERASNPPVYISHIRGKEIDYSPESLKVILQLPDVDIEGPSYEARKSSNDQRLGDVLRDICEDHAQWKLDIKGK
ncbi:hypothetical protein PIB30_029407 [Stylosanthes scabra]|uniref:Putative plant transposon protein domain-containing protein n=1 Tax=Stylosanthes scabra TaxID=79078 RepID=A0ABU6VDG7_9FABA|nr:hypothetical protein [Stylosanthes scabra]